MFVQMCVKGINGISRDEAHVILERGLACAWWRKSAHITSAEINQRLTREELDLHVHSYEEKHPNRGGLVCDQSPFISLTAGSVERDAFYSRNEINPAHIIALNFATGFGQPGECYLFYCWVLVALRPSVPVRHLAEEVRELHTYTRYSPYQPEGEIAAKIEVPAPQIEKFERYEYGQDGNGNMRITLLETKPNEGYISPHDVTNYRD
jgi:hypothetical protein